MMATTHAYLALALAVPTLPVVGGHAPGEAILGTAFLGGLLPDLDAVTDHRKALHFPVYFPVGACLVLVAYGVVGHQSLFLLAVVVAAAGLHSATDILAGGLGREPWREQSGKAVYNHFLDGWHTPRRVVRYSGAPEDFVLASAFAVPAVLAPATGSTADAVLAVVLVASGTYAAVRRHVPVVARSVRVLLPRVVADRLPSVRVEET